MFITKLRCCRVVPAIKYADVTVGLAFTRTYWSFNYVNTAYVAMYITNVVADGNCSDANDTTSWLRELTLQPDDRLLVLSQTVMAKWPTVTAEPLNLITAPSEAEMLAAGDVPPRFKLNTAAVGAIESMKNYSSREARLLPIGVVGNLREGKSTLQNMLMQLYDIKGSDCSVVTAAEGRNASQNDVKEEKTKKRKDSRLEYFETSNSLQSKTTGANCYMLPYFRDQQTWILFVDFEGFGDPKKPIHMCSDYDVRLFAVAIAILKCMLYNTRSSVDHYVIDHLKALKYVADDSLFSSMPLLSQRSKPEPNKPSIFLVMRDFSLQLVDKSTQSTVAYYKNLLFEENKDSSAFLKERFHRFEVHPLPRPIESKEIECVSQLPLSVLVPEFQAAVKHLARDVGFWAEDSQQSPSTAPTNLDTFQQFAKRVGGAIDAVNKSKSQPLMMTAMLAHQAVHSVVFSMEAQIQAQLDPKKLKLPLPDTALDAAFDDACTAVYKEFTKQTASISKSRAGGGGSIDMVISDAWIKVREKAERERALLVTTNEKAAQELAMEARQELMNKAPVEAKLLHPDGHEDMLIEFRCLSNNWLRGRLEHCPKHIAKKHVDEFNDNLVRLHASVKALNDERRRADQQRMEQEEAAQANQSKIDALLRDKGDQATKLEHFATLSHELNEQLKQSAQEHGAKLDQLATERHRAVEEEHASGEKKAESRLSDQRRDFEKQLEMLRKKHQEQFERAEEAEKKSREHRCHGGCLPGDALVVARTAGPKLLKDVCVGEFILVSTTVAADGSEQRCFEPVGGFFDYKPNAVAAFVTLELEDAAAPVSLTAAHLIWCTLPGDDKRPQLLQAGKVVPGMRLIDTSGAVTRTVVRVTRDVERMGVFSPFVPSGSFVANGVRVSVYAKPQCLAILQVSDEQLHALCHVVTLPMRVVAQWAAAHEWVSANHLVCHGVTKLLKVVAPIFAGLLRQRIITAITERA